MVNLVDSISQLLSPWATVYSDSTVLQTVVLYCHLAGVLLGGGLAIGADRTTLRVARAPREIRSHHLEELRDIHRPVLIGLGAVLLSGLLMLAADFHTFALSPVFWGKMIVVGALLGNGRGLQRAEQALRRRGSSESAIQWRLLRRGAVISLMLWFVALLVGAVLPALT
jgi:hypothetical protein